MMSQMRAAGRPAAGRLPIWPEVAPMPVMTASGRLQPGVVLDMVSALPHTTGVCFLPPPPH